MCAAECSRTAPLPTPFSEVSRASGPSLAFSHEKPLLPDALLAPFSIAEAQQGDLFREDVEARYIGAGKSSATFMGKVYGTAPKVSTTMWTFQRIPAQSAGVTYNTVASIAQIDCSVRTMQRTSLMLLLGEAAGPDQKSRVVARQTITEAAQSYPNGTIFASFIDRACATTPPDEKKNPP